MPLHVEEICVFWSRLCTRYNLVCLFLAMSKYQHFVFLLYIHHHPLSSSPISLLKVCHAAACEHACIIFARVPCVIVGRGGAMDLAATVVMCTDDCAWKQKRSRLIQLSSTSERLLAGVRGRLMRKHKASARFLSLCLCLCVCVRAAQRSDW